MKRRGGAGAPFVLGLELPVTLMDIPGVAARGRPVPTPLLL